jgi:hypothetical protein
MSKSDDEREKQELLRALAETKEIAPKLIEKGRNLTEAGQSALDWASTVESLASKVPGGLFRHPTLTNVSSGFREFNSIAQRQSEQITEDVKLIRILHSTTTTTSVTSSAIVFTALGSSGDAMPELKSMDMLLHRSVDVAKVCESMKALGLDAPHGNIRSPVELLRTAEEALRRPFSNEGYATAVLVPLRESIQACVDELLKLRPTVEKAGGLANKLASIARHCGKDGISPDHIDRVAATTHMLIDALSAAKDRQMNRDRILGLFDQGVSLLQDIASLVDSDKLRSATK